MAVKGMPQPPKIKAPEPLPENAGWWKRREHAREQSQYEKQVAEYEEQYQRFYNHAIESARGRGNPLLTFAIHGRSERIGNLYDSAAEYVSDLWSDGFLEADQALKLLDEIQLNKGQPGPVTYQFLVQEIANRHLKENEVRSMNAFIPPSLANTLASERISRTQLLEVMRDDPNPIEAVAAIISAREQLNKGTLAEREVQRAVEQNEASAQGHMQRG